MWKRADLCDFTGTNIIKILWYICPAVTILTDDFEDVSLLAFTSANDPSGNSDAENDDSEFKYYHWFSIEGKASKAFAITHVVGVENSLIE